MLQRLSNKVYTVFNIGQVIDKEKEELYRYGIQIFLSNIIEVFSAVIIGIVFSAVTEMIILLVSFIVTRRFTGGYHAKTFGRCSLLTSTVMILSILIQKYIYIPFNICILIGIISFIIFILFVPIENENKRLSDELKRKCKIKAFIVLSVQLILGYILYYYKISSYSIIFISLFFVDIFISISVRRKGEKGNEENCIKGDRKNCF